MPTARRPDQRVLRVRRGPVRPGDRAGAGWPADPAAGPGRRRPGPAGQHAGRPHHRRTAAAGALERHHAGSTPGDHAGTVRAAGRPDPDAVAVIGDGTELSYGELNARASQLARHLITLGAGPSGTSPSRCPAPRHDHRHPGGPEDRRRLRPRRPAYPAGRLAYMLTDTSPVAVITTTAAGQDLPGSAPQLILDDPATRRALTALDDTDPGITPHRPARPT